MCIRDSCNSSDKGMRRRGGDTFPPSNQIPSDSGITPANIIGKVIYCSTTVLDTVLAIPNPPIIYLAIKKATKLKKAAHNLSLIHI